MRMRAFSVPILIFEERQSQNCGVFHGDKLICECECSQEQMPRTFVLRNGL